MRGRNFFEYGSFGLCVASALQFAAIQSLAQTAVGGTSMPASEAIAIPLDQTIRNVWDSGLYRRWTTAGGMFWLDNETVVVSANKDRKPRTQAEARAQEEWLYVWRLGDRPKPYGADPKAAARTYCAASGQISYYQDRIDPNSGRSDPVRLEGPLGRERETEVLHALRPGAAWNAPGIERTDCDLYADSRMGDTRYVTDSEHRYYLSFGKDPILASANIIPSEPLTLSRADGSDRSILPISSANAAVGSVHYHMFDRHFYVWIATLSTSPVDHFKAWRDSSCWPIWKIEPETATTEKLCIPFGPWSGAMRGGTATSLVLAPTKAGLFFGSNPVHLGEDHGLYRLENGVVTKVLPGFVWNLSVSPDGCRIALVYYPNDESYRPISPESSSVISIDVCAAS